MHDRRIHFSWVTWETAEPSPRLCQSFSTCPQYRTDQSVHHIWNIAMESEHKNWRTSSFDCLLKKKLSNIFSLSLTWLVLRYSSIFSPLPFFFVWTRMSEEIFLLKNSIFFLFFLIRNNYKFVPFWIWNDFGVVFGIFNADYCFSSSFANNYESRLCDFIILNSKPSFNFFSWVYTPTYYHSCLRDTMLNYFLALTKYSFIYKSTNMICARAVEWMESRHHFLWNSNQKYTNERINLCLDKFRLLVFSEFSIIRNFWVDWPDVSLMNFDFNINNEQDFVCSWIMYNLFKNLVELWKRWSKLWEKKFLVDDDSPLAGI